MKPNYSEKAKLCYTDTDSLIVYIKADDIYKDVAEDVEIRLHNSNYGLERPLPKGKYKKVIALMKDELDKTNMEDLTVTTTKIKKAKDAKKACHKKAS